MCKTKLKKGCIRSFRQSFVTTRTISDGNGGTKIVKGKETLAVRTNLMSK